MYLLLQYIHIFIMCVSTGMHMPQWVCGSQRTPFWESLLAFHLVEAGFLVSSTLHSPAGWSMRLQMIFHLCFPPPQKSAEITDVYHCTWLFMLIQGIELRRSDSPRKPSYPLSHLAYPIPYAMAFRGLGIMP